MPSLWRRVVRSKHDHEARTTDMGSLQPQPRNTVYQHEDLTTSAETRLYYLSSGQTMRLLRQVHLVDPVQSPSWSGVQRSTQECPSILHMIDAEETRKLSKTAELLQPGIVECTSNPNILSVRGLLLDTVKHVGSAIEHSSSDSQSYNPPKWLKKLVTTKNSTALREFPLNIAANPARKPKNDPQAALVEKYDDFMASVFGLTNNQRNPAQGQKPDKSFDNVKMCVTQAGYFGLVPPSARVGDHIFMIERDVSKSLFIVRKHAVYGFYLWNGLVYIQNLAQAVTNEHATDRLLVG